jgi:serine/threonine-protein kinase
MLLSPRLDEALEMSEAERSLWLSSLRAEEPTLARHLEELLLEHGMLSEESFLERSFQPMPLGPPYPGQAVGPYDLIKEVGHGGMGNVWLAKRSDGRFQRQVAIKFLNIGFLGRGGEQRFKREGRILARLAHAHIAELVDASVTPEGQPYLVLEYVAGDHIDSYCDQRSLDIHARIRLFLDVLHAVSHAHGSLIVHCDIKPSNVLVRNDGQVKLLDFGIAKLLAEEGETGETTLLTNDVLRPMTPGYASPEQLQGEAVTTSTDVYALGVLLYELLTGQHPVGPGSPADVIRAIVTLEPLRPSAVVDPVGTVSEAAATRAARRSTTPDKLRRLLRGDLDTIVGKALKKTPAERYSSVTAFADDLRRYLRNQPISARPETLAYRTRKFLQRNRMPAVLSLLAIAAILVGAAGTLFQARTARFERDFALRQLARAERMNDLNELLLTDVAPLGKPLTANELLKREERIVEREHYDDTADHVEMLISIGGQYSGEGDNAEARRILQQAYNLSLGLGDPAVRAKASCELGWAINVSGETARADSLVEEGLRELPGQPQFAPVRITCLLHRADIAYRSGNAKLQLASALAAAQTWKASAVHTPAEEVEVLMAVAGGYGMTGQAREANTSYEQAAARMTDVGYDETQKAVKLFNDWGLMLIDAGRPRPAEQVFRRAINISQTNQTEDTVLPALLHNYSLVLRDLGRLTEALDYEQRARQKAIATGDQVLAAQTNMQLSRIYRDQRDFTRAAAVLADAETTLQRVLPPGHFGFASLTSDKELLALAQGDRLRALQLANQAVALDEAAIKAGGLGAAYLPALLVRRSAVELETGDSKQAAADANRAITLLTGMMEPGALSSGMGRAYLALGRASQATGNTEEAHLEFRHAEENLRDSLGPDHPDTRSAREMAAANALRH